MDAPALPRPVTLTRVLPLLRPVPRPRVGPLSRVAPLSRAPRAGVRGALLAILLLLAWTVPGPAGAEGPRWLWPVPAPHPVLAAFEAPLHEYGPGHRGIDIGTGGAGTPVRAVEAGVVRFRGSIAGRGVVSVQHADGLLSTYEPVRGEVDAGDRVEAGTVLGELEDAEAASHCPGSVCLHLGARQGEVYRDPLPLLGARGPSVLLPWEGGEGVTVRAAPAGGSSAAGAGSAGSRPTGSASARAGSTGSGPTGSGPTGSGAPGAHLAPGGAPSAVPGVRSASSD